MDIRSCLWQKIRDRLRKDTVQKNDPLYCTKSRQGVTEQLKAENRLLWVKK